MPTVTVTFVHATFFLATFVHIRNTSAVTDPMLTKLFWSNYLGAPTFFLDLNLFEPNFFWPKTAQKPKGFNTKATQSCFSIWFIINYVDNSAKRVAFQVQEFANSMLDLLTCFSSLVPSSLIDAQKLPTLSLSCPWVCGVSWYRQGDYRGRGDQTGWWWSPLQRWSYGDLSSPPHTSPLLSRSSTKF